MSFFFIACENDLKVVEHISGKGKLTPTESSVNLNVVYTDSGKIEFRLKAPYMEHFVNGTKEPYTEYNKGIYIEQYGDNYQLIATIKSNYAIRYDNLKKMEARYKVEIMNIDGEILKTEKITLDEQTKKIYTDQYVEIKTKHEVIKGVGMEANQDFTEWEIKEVSGTLPLNE